MDNPEIKKYKELLKHRDTGQLTYLIGELTRIYSEERSGVLGKSPEDLTKRLLKSITSVSWSHPVQSVIWRGLFRKLMPGMDFDEINKNAGRFTRFPRFRFNPEEPIMDREYSMQFTLRVEPYEGETRYDNFNLVYRGLGDLFRYEGMAKRALSESDWVAVNLIKPMDLDDIRLELDKYMNSLTLAEFEAVEALTRESDARQALVSARDFIMRKYVIVDLSDLAKTWGICIDVSNITSDFGVEVKTVRLILGDSHELFDSKHGDKEILCLGPKGPLVAAESLDDLVSRFGRPGDAVPLSENRFGRILMEARRLVNT